MEDKTVLAAFMVAMMVMTVASTFSSMEDRMDSQQDYAESLDDRTDQAIETMEGTLANHEATMGYSITSLGSQITTLESQITTLESQLEASGVENQFPVVYSVGPLEMGDYSGCNGNPPTYDELLNIHAIDFDGNIVRMGVDLDMDGQIDFELTELGRILETDAGGNVTERTTVEVSDYSIPTMYEIPIEQCVDSDAMDDMSQNSEHLWFNIVAIDDGGATTVHPQAIPT